MTARDLGAGVRLARERARLTQQELARRVRMDRTALNKVERGARRLAALELSDIAGALGVPMISFFEEPILSVASHHSARGLATEESGVSAALERIAREVEFVQGLTDVGGAEPLQRPPLRSHAQAEDMAVSLRDQWGLEDHEPALDLVGRAAEMGLYIFSADLDEDVADAGMIALRRGGVALVNGEQKVGRRRLCAAHELGHYLVGDEYTVDFRDSQGDRVEEYLDAFARAVLLPRAAIAVRWARWEAADGVRAAAVRMAGTYHVDMTTLARRLREVGAVDARGAGAVRAARTTKADMVTFDLHVRDDLEGVTQPRAFQRAVLSLVEEERISRERALELLGGTFQPGDLPAARRKGEEAAWDYAM